MDDLQWFACSLEALPHVSIFRMSSDRLPVANTNVLNVRSKLYGSSRLYICPDQLLSCIWTASFFAGDKINAFDVVSLSLLRNHLA
jgi:hypothetical protein